MAELACVNPDNIRYWWPHVSEWVRAAMVRGDLGLFSDIEADVLSGGALLWLVFNGRDIRAAVVSQIVTVESGKVCIVVACGGRGVIRALPLLSGIEDYARAEGCRAVRIMGRQGWERALPQYQRTKIVLEKPL